MTEEQHIELLEAIQNLEGKVILSGFHSELYESYLGGWHRIETQARGQAGGGTGTKMNTEVLWIHPRALKSLPLFEAV